MSSEIPEGIPQWAWDQTLGAHVSLYGRDATFVRTYIARALLAAEARGIERAAKLIEEGFDREVARPYRNDGKPSKTDECPHGKYMYEDCEQCSVRAIRQLLEKQG